VRDLNLLTIGTLERLAFAAVLIAVLWLGVVWALA
jgi:hypothetical protein